jgi:hypothetical protein
VGGLLEEIGRVFWLRLRFGTGLPSVVGPCITPDPPFARHVVQVLKAARQRQREERLRFGEGYGGGEYVCSDEMRNPLHPDAITRSSKVVRMSGMAPSRSRRRACSRAEYAR